MAWDPDGPQWNISSYGMGMTPRPKNAYYHLALRLLPMDSLSGLSQQNQDSNVNLEVVSLMQAKSKSINWAACKDRLDEDLFDYCAKLVTCRCNNEGHSRQRENARANWLDRVHWLDELLFVVLIGEVRGWTIVLLLSL
jgi:hypothetical protein